MSMTPQSTSQSTLMKPKPTPTVHCNSLHPSSHLILSMDSLDNLITLGQTPISSHQSPIGALGHPSLPQCSGLVPALNGQLGIHPTHDGAKTHLQFPSNPNPVSPYSNYSMLFVSLQPCAYYSCTQPWFLCSCIPVPPNSWL